MRGIHRRFWSILLIAALLCGTVSVQTANAKTDCKALCQAALKAVGNGSRLKYTSTEVSDFGGLSYSDRTKVKNICYVCDEKEAYSLCVMEAKNASGMKALQKAMKKYKKRNNSSGYLSDYSSEEQNVFKNAVYGSSKGYVWYIAMSPKKAGNTKGQAALKKQL